MQRKKMAMPQTLSTPWPAARAGSLPAGRSGAGARPQRGVRLLIAADGATEARARSETRYGDELVLLRVRESLLWWQYWLRSVLTLGLYSLAWSDRHLTITSERIIWRPGLLRAYETIRIDHLAGVEIKRGRLGRLLNYGTLRITSLEGQTITAPHVTAPGRVDETIRLAYERRLRGTRPYRELPAPWLQFVALAMSLLPPIIVVVAISLH